MSLKQPYLSAAACTLLATSLALGGSCPCAAAPKSIDVMPAEAERYALLIGVEKYQDKSVGSLEGPSKDVAELKTALRMAGFPEDNIIVLASDSPAELQPTHNNIVKHLTGLKTWVPTGGLLVVAFSGHGYEPPEPGSQPYLLPSDVVFSAELEALEQTSIPLKNLHKAISGAHFKKVIVLIDACRDQFDHAKKGPASSSILTKRYEDALKWDRQNDHIEAFATLFATGEGHPAYIFKEKRESYFSYVFVQGVKGDAKDANNRITLGSLESYLENQVPPLVKKDYGERAIQEPHATISGFKANDLLIRTVSTADANFAYKYSGHIQPSGDIDDEFSKTFPLDDHLEDCRKRDDRVTTLCLGDAQSPVMLEKISALHACSNQTSISPPTPSSSDPTCIQIKYHLQGCSAHRVSTDDCSRRPGLHADIILKSTRSKHVTFESESFPERSVTDGATVLSLQYSKELPKTISHLTWTYGVSVTRQLGPALFSAHLGPENPAEQGVVADISGNGLLTVDLSKAMDSWRVLQSASTAGPPAQ